MKFVQGRSNLSVTVFVPWDCDNDCPFCTSKKEYKDTTMDFVKVQEYLKKINNSSISEVVITGGEPSKNIEMLSNMLLQIHLKEVYINTTVPIGNEIKFIKLVNSLKHIRGVNISRHSFVQDDNNVCSDAVLGYIIAPIHINVVTPNTESLQNYIERYRWLAKIRKSCKFGDLTICIRADFRYITKDTLHSKDDEMLKSLGNLGYKLLRHTYCNVCDTYVFEIEDGFYISYHRGLQNTSIEYTDKIEVNDIVIFPDGTLCYDWDKNKVCDESIFNIRNNSLPVQKIPFYYPCQVPFPNCAPLSTAETCGCSVKC